MKFLVDVGHPAVVHFYIPIIKELQKRGHTVKIVSRDKDLTASLLDEFNLEHQVISKARKTLSGMFFELIEREFKLLKIALKFKPDVITGTSVNAARVAKLVGARSVILNEDDAAVVPLFRWLAYPFATAIVTPDVLAFENYGERHLTYPSFEKIFYLHPNRFTSNHEIPEKLMQGSPDGRYVIFRFSALRAHHDVGAKGLSVETVQSAIDSLSTKTNVWISSEREIPEIWAKYRYPFPSRTMHDALSKATLLLTDSQSMSVESAVLGVKSLRLNSFVGRLSVLKDLDHRVLSEGFLPGQEGKFLERISYFRDNLVSELDAQKKRYQKLLEDKCDPLPWTVDLLEKIGERKKSLTEIYSEFKKWPFHKQQKISQSDTNRPEILAF